jgi:hypothetical protein
VSSLPSLSISCNSYADLCQFYHCGSLYDEANFNSKKSEFSAAYLQVQVDAIRAEVKKFEDHPKYKELQHWLYSLLASGNKKCESFFVA